MTLRPCISCGVPSEGARCDEHTIVNKPSPESRGYDWTWAKLSRRARKAQPFCTICGTSKDLQADHVNELSWERARAGKPLRLGIDVQVLCAAHNREKGQARP